ncbi:hypothetical protein B484DRAFT_393636 [Ochromonadaceae sp. CCMP2298]|nr:hypothetical protein B484DRAFT_393636 [Ochromonadaceae sp. CCMP2298]
MVREIRLWNAQAEVKFYHSCQDSSINDTFQSQATLWEILLREDPPSLPPSPTEGGSDPVVMSLPYPLPDDGVVDLMDDNDEANSTSAQVASAPSQFTLTAASEGTARSDDQSTGGPRFQHAQALESNKASPLRAQWSQTDLDAAAASAASKAASAPQGSGQQGRDLGRGVSHGHRPAKVHYGTLASSAAIAAAKEARPMHNSDPNDTAEEADRKRHRSNFGAQTKKTDTRVSRNITLRLTAVTLHKTPTTLPTPPVTLVTPETIVSIVAKQLLGAGEWVLR